MRPLSTRTAGFTDSIIRRMTRISNRYGAINLSQGFPDFDPPREITERLAEIAPRGPHQYAVTWGAQNFRKALAKKQSHWTGLPIDADKNIVVTCGSTEAMMAAMMTVVNPGDRVAIFSPFYENYTADTILTGAEPVYIPLVPPTFSFDANLIEDAFRQGAKALVLCNPSNPCGKVFTREELQQIADIIIRYDGYVITDLAGLHAGIDFVTTNFSLQCSGYWVKDGKRDHSVSLVTVAANFLEMMKQVTAVGSDLDWKYHSIVTPSIAFQGCAISGK